MFNLFLVLILIVSVLLVLVVLVQNSKGGGLDSQFSSNNQFMGVRKTTDFIEKATWGLAIALVVLSVFASVFASKDGVQQRSGLSEQANKAVQTTPLTTSPVQQPKTGNETKTETPE